jgi:hypothetical protein
MKRIKLNDDRVPVENLSQTYQIYTCGDPDCQAEIPDVARVPLPFARAKHSRANSRILKLLCPNCGKGWQLNQIFEIGQWKTVEGSLITDSSILADLRARVNEQIGNRQRHPEKIRDLEKVA